MDPYKASNLITSTLALDPLTPPFATISYAMFDKAGAFYTYLNAQGSLKLSAGGIVPAIQNIAAAALTGTITTVSGSVFINATSAAALTLAAPAAVDDGKQLDIISTTAIAHTVTNASPGFNNGGSGADVATFGTQTGNSLSLVAKNLIWYVKDSTGITLG